MPKVPQLASRAARRLGRMSTGRVDFLLAVLITAAGLGLYSFVNVGGNPRASFAFLQNIELRSLDMRFQARGKRAIDPRIVIVGLDEKTLRQVGSFPIGRNYYARLVDRLNAGGASIVGFDFDFPTPERNSAVEALKKLQAETGTQLTPGMEQDIRQIERSTNNDAIFAESIKKAGNVVLGHLFLDASRAGEVNPKAAEEYYNILWGKPFPTMQPVQSKKGGSVPVDEAWRDRAWRVNGGGFVAQSVEPNITLLASAARSYGFFSEEPDPDGTYRRALLLVRYQDLDWYPSLALECWRQYRNVPDQEIVGYLSQNGLERLQYGDQTLWPRHDATALINYAGPYQTYPQYSMIDVIDGQVPEKSFQGKIVLVGATALGIGDLRNTPFQSHDYMGVEIHANVLDNLLHNGEKGRGFLARGDREEMIDIAVILFFGLGLGLLFGRIKPLYSTLSVLLALAAFGVLAYYAFAHWGMWLSFVVPAGVLVANYGAITSFRMIFEEREKRKIRRSFGAYVSPGVIRLIENNPALLRPGGEMKELTIMFSDIRSFTSVSEGLTPDELVLLLNEYLGEMTQILFKWWGTLDKYIGDAIMGFWGSPYPQDDHAYRACTCALEMSARLDELNVKWAEEGRKTLNIGIGVNTGPVNVGNMGSPQRLAWTVMGDHVNLSSRLEGLTKKYHVRIVLSEFTYQQVQQAYVTRELDRITVVGRSQPVAIYQLLDFLTGLERYEDLLERWEKALEAYKAQQWGKAADQFEAILAAYPGDGPSETLLERCKRFMIHPPAPDWDGVYVMESK